MSPVKNKMENMKRFLLSLCMCLGMLETCVAGRELSARQAIAFSSHNRQLRMKRTTATAEGLQMKGLFIESNVSVRFATVLIQSEIQNGGIEDKETRFVVQIPSSAFISSFSMIIGDDEFEGIVMGKEEATKVYEKAKDDNNTAGLVSQTETPRAQRDFEIFTVTVNVASNSTGLFKLRYDQLIERRNNVYTQIISVQPFQIVPNMTIVCNYYEPQGILFDPSSGIATPTSTNAVDLSLTGPSDVKYEHQSDNRFRVVYSPSLETQTTADPLNGIAGDLRITYDVKRDEKGSFTIANPDGGYLVTFFSPKFPDNDLFRKNIIFLIDISGSMSGDKIGHARQSMRTMISRLQPTDRFNILLFSDKVGMWKSGFLPAYDANKEQATTFVDIEVKAGGGTNINSGLLASITMFEEIFTEGNLIFLLTDGDPTVGTTNKDSIRENVRLANRNKKEGLKAVLISLAYGAGVEFDFLKALSLENGGFVRMIYAENDAKEQLENVFMEISDPALKDVHINIRDVNTGKKLVGDTSKRQTPLYFANSEFVTVGNFFEPLPTIECIVEAQGANGPMTYTSSPSVSTEIQIDPVFIERLYAYKRINGLLDDALTALSDDESNQFREKALNLSLQFQFVTPLTSLVVTQAMQKRPSVDQFGTEEFAVDVGRGRPMSKNSSPINTSTGSYIVISKLLSFVSMILVVFIGFNF